MATILNGDIGVEYFGNNRQKRLYWIGGTNTSYTMNEVYSATQTLLDENDTIDDGTAFFADTPVEYTIGKIDSGDNEPWYITFDLMEKITGGSLRTSGWTRVTSTNTGIIIVPVSPGGTISSSDEGFDISGGTTGNGTLLEFIDTGGTYDYCVIRPDSSAAGDDFTTASQTLTCNANTATQWANANSTTGDMVWANLYSIGTIDSNVHLYLYQGAANDDTSRTRLASWNDATQDWYGNGHIDVTVAMKDIEATTWTTIDGGYVSVFGRKSGDSYANFEVATSTTSGGRNPIPVQTANDLDQVTGIKQQNFTGAITGTFVDGEIITGGTSGARGILDLSNSTTTSGGDLVYFPIDDPQVDFVTTETITGATSGATCTTTGTPANYGPAINTWFTSTITPTISFTNANSDIDDDGTDETYGITINCQNNPLTEVYEWCKYATRNGETTNDLDNINGERYIGAEVTLYYGDTATITGTINEGDDVTQETTGATGVIISIDTTNKLIMLRDTRGTFATGSATDHTVTSNDNAGTVEMETADNATVSTYAPKTASPLGTFAGGTFFGARGVLLTNYLAADENSFILTPVEGGTKQRPASITMKVTNLDGGARTSALHDKVGLYRRTGAAGDINKTEYAASGGEAVGANTLTVTTSIAQDVPGKTTGGRVTIVDTSDGGQEYVLRYSSWTGSVFTLAEITGTATAGTGATTLVNSGATFQDGADEVKRGDLVTVSGKGSAYVETVDSQTQLTLAGAGISGFVSTDAYEINTVPVAVTASDYVFVPFIHEVAESAEESVSVIYNSQIYYRAKVRNTRAATKIRPFSVDGTTTGTDVSVATIRTEDTIIT
jgi:hypothetical protein